ncbi:integrase, catalytic region, zinc finger, CCHC-type containing protein [Tanacetum coccineum]
MGTVRFENDHFTTIIGYGDYVQGNLTICHVYYVEGLGHNLFSVRQFCDGDLEVAFRSNTCYVQNLEGGDLLIGSRDSNLYTISISEMAASSPVCLMSRATSTKSWLWHRRLSYLNFGTINQLTSKDLVDGLPKFKYNKDHLYMSTSKTYQQSLADAGSETRPPMLERGSYIPWASRFKRFLNRKRENRKWLLKALEDGPYVFRNITPTGSTIPRLQEVEDLQGDDLLYYDAEMELMNMILLSIPNEIYNSVDSCKTAKEMWARVERLMRGTIQNQVDRETRFTNEFDQFVAEPGESLVSVYNRFAQLMNDLERNNMKFPTVSVNTKFLNSLQPEWLKYKGITSYECQFSNGTLKSVPDEIHHRVLEFHLDYNKEMPKTK